MSLRATLRLSRSCARKWHLCKPITLLNDPQSLTKQTLQQQRRVLGPANANAIEEHGVAAKHHQGDAALAHSLYISTSSKWRSVVSLTME